MKLISVGAPTAQELNYAYSLEEAQMVVRQSLDTFDTIEGLAQLRQELMLDLNSEVLAQVEGGEWLLIKDQAYYFDNTMVEKQIKARRREQRVFEIMRSPPPQPKIERTYFRLLDSETGEPLIHRRAILWANEEKLHCSTDEFGVAHTRKLTREEITSARISFQLTGRY